MNDATGTEPLSGRVTVVPPTGHTAVLPKPELRGTGRVTYRCAACGEPVEDPVYSNGDWVADQPIELTPAVRTYHREHTGGTNGSRSAA